MKEQNNNLFQVIRNKDHDCFDVILKKDSYNTSLELLGILSWIHQVGVNEPDVKLRIGSDVNQNEVENPCLSMVGDDAFEECVKAMVGEEK